MKDVIQTEIPFSLPTGFLDPEGTLQREGVMRLATAADEILPLQDHRVQSNPAYHAVILLTRVIVRLGGLRSISTQVVEQLYVQDFAYLQELYNQLNEKGRPSVTAQCPSCKENFEVPLEASGEFEATP